MKKRYVILCAFYALSSFGAQIPKDESKKALKERGITISENSVGTADRIKLVEITNNSKSPIVYDPNKITSYLEDNGERFLKKVQFERMLQLLSGVGVQIVALGAVGLLEKQIYDLEREENERQMRRAREMFQETTRNRNEWVNAFGNQYLGLPVAPVRIRPYKIKIPLSQRILEYTPFWGIGSLIGLKSIWAYNKLSPKNIIKDKVVIEPGKELKVLLWFKSKEQWKMVGLKRKCSSETYQAMNTALESEKK